MFYNGSGSILKILVSAPITYITIILYIRYFGKRTTSQMNSFDWIVTVAIGSIAASTVILDGVPILNGILAIFILILLQFAITKTIIISSKTRRLVLSTPMLLLFEGDFLDKNLKSERVTRAEIMAAIRESGLPNINEVYAVVLETNANFSVIGMDKRNTSFSLADVGGLPEGLKSELKTIRDSGEFPDKIL